MKNTLSRSILIIMSLAFLTYHPGRAQDTKMAAEILAFSGASRAEIQKNYAIFDSDADGKVTRTEFRLQTGEFFFVRDKNKDIFLTPDEMPNASARTFAAADSNGDGKLTPHEFGEADFMKFETYDLDKSGSITIEEVYVVLEKYRR
jgi:Ca2+-binding EF-hand superfamily protein